MPIAGIIITMRPSLLPPNSRTIRIPYLVLLRLIVKTESYLIYKDRMLVVLIIPVPQTVCKIDHTHFNLVWGRVTGDRYLTQFPHFQYSGYDPIRCYV